MSTHNLCFHGEIRKISELLGLKSTLSEAMVTMVQVNPCFLETKLKPGILCSTVGSANHSATWAQLFKANDVVS